MASERIIRGYARRGAFDGDMIRLTITHTPHAEMQLPVTIVPTEKYDALVEENRRLRKALEPFARYACDPPNSCDDDDGDQCSNCIARAALEAPR